MASESASGGTMPCVDNEPLEPIQEAMKLKTILLSSIDRASDLYKTWQGLRIDGNSAIAEQVAKCIDNLIKITS